MRIITTFLFIANTMMALAAEKLIDGKLAAKAEVVLRVKRLTVGEGSKYLWYRVEVLQVLKNESSEVFTNTLSVAAYSFKDGVPGESPRFTLSDTTRPTRDFGSWSVERRPPVSVM